MDSLKHSLRRTNESRNRRKNKCFCAEHSYRSNGIYVLCILPDSKAGLCPSGRAELLYTRNRTAYHIFLLSVFVVQNIDYIPKKRREIWKMDKEKINIELIQVAAFNYPDYLEDNILMAS